MLPRFLVVPNYVRVPLSSFGTCEEVLKKIPHNQQRSGAGFVTVLEEHLVALHRVLLVAALH